VTGSMTLEISSVRGLPIRKCGGHVWVHFRMGDRHR
jgi:hypothetical protein